MEILTVIDLLEEKIERAFNIPIINRALIDKEDILADIEDLRLKMPEDIKQAKWVKEERKRILAEAQQEADSIIKSAEEKMAMMISEHEVTKKAYEQANEIIAAAQKNARDIRLGTKQYADNILNELEQKLVKTAEIINNSRKELNKHQ